MQKGFPNESWTWGAALFGNFFFLSRAALFRIESESSWCCRVFSHVI